MLELGLACDGGKDSLSMAANADGEVRTSPPPPPPPPLSRGTIYCESSAALIA